MNSLYIVGGIVVATAVGVALYPAFRVLPFVYGSSRVRAAKARLFTDDELAGLAGESYMDAIYHLEKRGLKDLLDLIEADFREELVQRRLSLDYLQQLDKLIQYVPGRYRAFFSALREESTMRFIIAVLRSKTSQFHDRHIIEHSFPVAAQFKNSDSEQIEELGLDDFLSRIKNTRYYPLIAERIEDVRSGKLSDFESAMHALHFADLKKAARGDVTLERYVRMLIDMHNVRHALAFGKRSFVPGGKLDEGAMRDLETASSAKDVARALEKTRYAEHVKDAETIVEIERGLFRAQKAFSRALAKNQPLSIDPILSYYIAKKLELRNIRTLLKLIYVRFKPDEIRRLLI